MVYNINTGEYKTESPMYEALNLLLYSDVLFHYISAHVTILQINASSSPIFFSSQKNGYPLIFPVVKNKTKQTQNRQTGKSKINKPGIQAHAPPRKRKEYQFIRSSKWWLPFLSHRDITVCLFRLLAPCLNANR